ncbi:hypothetical protein LOK49_LG12G02460 [Camellia lanceoleosa]|uniref:Uncharacterized protein n=1 Tax=Camellia lanceoleosa TaxID=1840588 RepID=A0ACC0FPH7_9ERIC|nr:hypothetical protein LOK49_LG12G02460 [Camellia lanceoleosa]
MAARDRYARVCVEMDLRKPLTSYLIIGKYKYVVEYEHVHLLCFACGRVGHRRERYMEYLMTVLEKMNQSKATTHLGTNGAGPSKPRGQEKKDGLNDDIIEGFGPWTTAPSRRRKAKPLKPKQKTSYPKSNKFEVLQEE